MNDVRKSTSDDPRVSPVGYYLAICILRFVPDQEHEFEESFKFDTDEIYMLVHANSPNEAYEKAVEIGSDMEFNDMIDVQTKVKGKRLFYGFADIIPIYDEVVDGCELLDCPASYTLAELEDRVTGKAGLSIFR